MARGIGNRLTAAAARHCGQGRFRGTGLARRVEGLFFGVEPWDPVAMTSVLGSMLAVGMAAYLIPARGVTSSALGRHETRLSSA